MILIPQVVSTCNRELHSVRDSRGRSNWKVEIRFGCFDGCLIKICKFSKEMNKEIVSKIKVSTTKKSFFQVRNNNLLRQDYFRRQTIYFLRYDIWISISSSIVHVHSCLVSDLLSFPTAFTIFIWKGDRLILAPLNVNSSKLFEFVHQPKSTSI